VAAVDTRHLPLRVASKKLSVVISLRIQLSIAQPLRDGYNIEVMPCGTRL
jgi:hypothetical protein